MKNNLLNYGVTSFFEEKEVKANVARISFFSGHSYRIICANGEKEAVLKGSFKKECELSGSYPAVGDWVEFSLPQNSTVAVINFLYERKNKISRAILETGMEQIIASNIDTAFICMSLNKNFNLNRLSRYLFAIQNVNIVLLLTKSDLSENPEKAKSLIQNIYPKLEIFCISIYDPQTLDGIRKFFTKGKTCVVLGSSGVGKSSLINALMGEELLETKAINKKIDKGVHTTTSRQIISLGEELGVIIDTPGIKTLGIWDSDSGANSFEDVLELKENCLFRNCTHKNEKGCALLEAIDAGLLDKERYDAYMQLIFEDRIKLKRQNRQAKFLKRRAEKSKSAKRKFKEKRNIKQELAEFEGDLYE